MAIMSPQATARMMMTTMMMMTPRESQNLYSLLKFRQQQLQQKHHWHDWLVKLWDIQRQSLAIVRI